MFKLLIVAISYLVANSNGLNENEDSIIYDPTAPKPCSNNATSAYVDILLVIDTSSNMGNANLRKIGTTLSLILPKFTIGQQSDITQGYMNTRVGVITYDSNVNIIANYTDINSVLDVSKILNGLTASNGHAVNINDALFSALGVVNPCSENADGCIQLPYSRPTAIILFAAKAAVDDLSDNIGGIQGTLESLGENDATMITVNFNNADPILTGVLDIITYNKFADAPMYNFVGTSSSLTKDLEWAILQANCYCEQANTLYSSVKVQFDSTNNRYSRYRECLWQGPRTTNIQNPPVSTVEICDYLPIQSVPANILSADENKFFEAMLLDSHIDFFPPYFGLHKNKQSQWVYYDYNLTEFPMSSYTNWAPGYPKPNDKCAILDSIDSNHENLVWKSIGCDPSAQNFNFISSICQYEGCDSTTLDCCYACAVENQGGFEGKVKKMKRRSERKIKNSNGRFNRLINKN